MNKPIPGYCVEYCIKAESDPVNGLDIDSVEYRKEFFATYVAARNCADLIAASEPCPCVMGEIGIYDATYAHHGRLSPYWRVDDDAVPEWISPVLVPQERNAD